METLDADAPCFCPRAAAANAAPAAAPTAALAPRTYATHSVAQAVDVDVARKIVEMRCDWRGSRSNGGVYDAAVSYMEPGGIPRSHEIDRDRASEPVLGLW